MKKQLIKSIFTKVTPQQLTNIIEQKLSITQYSLILREKGEREADLCSNQEYNQTKVYRRSLRCRRFGYK